MKNKNFNETLLAKVGRSPSDFQGAVNTPVFHASTVLFPTLKELQESEKNMFDTFHYGRLGSPTTCSLENAIAELEGGYRGVVASSGLSIIAVVLLAYVTPGGHILIPNNVYGGVRRLCDEVLKPLNVIVEFYSVSPGLEIKNLIQPNTKLIYVESPGSTDLAIIDLPKLTKAAQEKSIPVVVDNTWATPLFFKPLKHGADVSIHSATKYLSGHSDSVLGVAACSKKSWFTIKRMAFLMGACVGADDAYLTLRGIRTLGVRLKRHQESALLIARWLQRRPEVERVCYPALSSDPGYQVWKRDYLGASGRFVVILKATSVQALSHMLDHMEHFGLGFSWGGFESIIAPVIPSNFSDRQKEKIALRISIGLESPSDLIRDFENGLSRLNNAHKLK